MKKKVGDLNLEVVNNGEELKRCRFEKKMETVSEAEVREKEMELKKKELVKKVDEAREMIVELKERAMKPGIRARK